MFSINGVRTTRYPLEEKNDHRPNKILKILEYNIGENLDNFGFGDVFLDISILHDRKKLVNWTSLKVKSSALQKILSRS